MLNIFLLSLLRTQKLLLFCNINCKVCIIDRKKTTGKYILEVDFRPAAIYKIYTVVHENNYARCERINLYCFIN